MFDRKDYCFRAKYRKLDTPCRLSNDLRGDIKFESDADKNWVFSLYPKFETLSDETKVGDEWEALDEGTVIFRKPIYNDKDGYFDMIRERIEVGARAYLVAGAHRIAELEITEIIDKL